MLDGVGIIRRVHVEGEPGGLATQPVLFRARRRCSLSPVA